LEMTGRTPRGDHGAWSLRGFHEGCRVRVRARSGTRARCDRTAHRRPSSWFRGRPAEVCAGGPAMPLPSRAPLVIALAAVLSGGGAAAGPSLEGRVHAAIDGGAR